MKVLLIKNYIPDRQYSMLAFADMLAQGLPDFGCHVEVISPPIRFGRGRDTTYGTGKWMGYIDKYLVAPKIIHRIAKSFQPDIVHVCDHSNAMYLSRFKQFHQLLNCHDLLAIKVWRGEISGESKSTIGGLQQWWIYHSIKQAQAIACISNKTSEDLRRLIPGINARIKDIPMGLNYPFQPISKTEADIRISKTGGIKTLSGKTMGDHWVLHVGNDGWYKNRIGALKIFRKTKEAMNSNVGMIFVGEAPSDQMLLESQGLEDSLAFIQNISNDMLEALYNKAKCLLFPSLAEGFGWPPIEAQACGCPTAVSDIEPLRSNCQSALLFNPNNVEAAARNLAALLSDDRQLTKISDSGLENAKRFTAAKMVSAYYDFYQEIIFNR